MKTIEQSFTAIQSWAQSLLRQHGPVSAVSIERHIWTVGRVLVAKNQQRHQTCRPNLQLVANHIYPTSTL